MDFKQKEKLLKMIAEYGMHKQLQEKEVADKIFDKISDIILSGKL